MICYRLHCAAGHEFEGWYKDSATFARLREGGLLSCPDCGSARVEQAPMAPAIVKGGRKSLASAPQQPEASAPVVAAGAAPQAQAVVPDALLGAMRRVREAIEENCENVGRNFADEALRMHHGEAPQRGIYGDMTSSDRELLEDEGVEFHTVPWVRKADG